MYLIIDIMGRSYWTDNLRTDSAMLGNVYDRKIQVFRFKDEKFERMSIYTEQRYPNGPGFFRYEWVDVSTQLEILGY